MPVTYIVMLLIITKLAICLIAIATTLIGLVLPSTSIKVVVVMATPVKNYQIGCAIQPTIHSIVGAQIHYE